MNRPPKPSAPRGQGPTAPLDHDDTTYDGYTIVPGVEIVELGSLGLVQLSVGGRSVTLNPWQARNLGAALHQCAWRLEALEKLKGNP